MNLCRVSAVLMGLTIICVDGSSDFSSQNLSTRFGVSPTATAPSLYPSSTQMHPIHSNAGATILASPYPPQPSDQTQTSPNYSNGAISTFSPPPQPSSTIIGQTQTTLTHSHETISTLPFLPRPSSTIGQIQTTPIHETPADITAVQSQVIPSQTEAKTVVPTTTGITSYIQQQALPPPTDTCSLCPVTSHSMRATDVTPMPTDMVQPSVILTRGMQYPTTSSATPSIMLPIWGWVTVVVGGLFVFSSCAIFFTVCFCLRMRNKRSADNYQQRSSRRQSVVSIDNRTPESATSTMEMIYPTEESDFKKGHPWDSLRESWSRRSSRRKFSTFKPQLYNQDKLPVADLKELQPSAPLGTTTTTTFGSQSASTLNTNIPETSHGISANKLSSISGHFVKEKYQSSPKAEPGYKCPPPSNPYYSSQDSAPNNFSTSLNYCQNQVFVSNPNYGNSDFQAPMPVLSNQTSASADLYQNFAANPAGSHRTSTRQATPMISSGYNDSAYLRTQANPPGYSVYGYQHALPNPSYNNNVDRGGTTPNNDTNDGYHNPLFDTALGRQTSHTELGRGSLAFDRKSTSFHQDTTTH